MAIGTSLRLSRVDCNSANIAGSNIPFKTYMKYLGVKIDQTFSVQDQLALSVVPLLSNYDALHPSNLIFPEKKKKICKTSRRSDYLSP